MFTIWPFFRSPESLNTLNSWVWIFGMVERETNTLLIYPVPDMSEDTVVPIIERHVEAWSTIYNGGWSAYCGLNELGYNHSTVLHKHSFKKVYINQETREEVEIHTNRIEGAWKHAKDHFRRMSGTKISRFEGHLCEIMWRAETKIKYLPELLLVPQHNLYSEWPTRLHVSNTNFPNMVLTGLSSCTTRGMGNLAR